MLGNTVASHLTHYLTQTAIYITDLQYPSLNGATFPENLDPTLSDVKHLSHGVAWRGESIK